MTTINFLNCFSGAMAQQLRQAPNTIMFANSPHNTVALDLSEWVKTDMLNPSDRQGFIRSKNGLSFYYDTIGASGVKELSLFEARAKANASMRNELRDVPEGQYSVGRTPFLESVIGWCEEGEPGRLSTARTKATWEALEKSSPEGAKALDAVDSEVRLERRYFDVSLRAPDFYDPKKTKLDSLF